jgi:hypothetical protein
MRRWCGILGCLLVCLVMRVAAQTPTPAPSDTETITPSPTPPTSLVVITPTPAPPNVANLTFTLYTTKDRSFSFEYPADWVVAQEDYYTTFTAPLSVGELTFTAFNPRVITVITDGQKDAVSAMHLLRDNYFGFIPDNISATTVGWRDAAIAPLTIGDRGAGVAMLLEMSRGGYGLVFAVTTQGQLSGFLPLIDTMLRRYDSPGNRRLATREQTTLNAFSGARENIIASLAAQQIIKPDVMLLDTLEQQDFTGEAAQFKPLAERLPTNNAIMIGEMAFEPHGGDSYESCAFVLHIVPAEAGDADQTLRHYLEVGFDQKGTLYYFDAGRNEERVINADLREGLSLERPFAFVLLLANERLTIYLNGVNVADNVLVRGVAGTAGLSLRPASPDTKCSFRNVALYRMTPLPAGVCTVAPRQFVTTHISPTNTSAAGTRLTAETPQQVMAYTAPSGSTLRWWKLEDGTWVREDGVEETGDCDNLPLED